MKSQIIILGCGSSIGTPVLGCDCQICINPSEKNIRTRSSILIQHNNYNILIDAGPDIKQQLLREKINKIDAIFFTHGHTDHIIGTGELRTLTKNSSEPIPIYANQETLQTINATAKFMFKLNLVTPYIIDNQTITLHNIKFDFHNIQHGSITNLAISITINNKRIIYLNDISNFTDEDITWLNKSDHIIIDAKEYYDSKNHIGFPKAKTLLSYIKYNKAYFTNMSHNINYYNLQTTITPKDTLCYDGLRINLHS